MEQQSNTNQKDSRNDLCESIARHILPKYLKRDADELLHNLDKIIFWYDKSKNRFYAREGDEMPDECITIYINEGLYDWCENEKETIPDEVLAQFAITKLEETPDDICQKNLLRQAFYAQNYVEPDFGEDEKQYTSYDDYDDDDDDDELEMMNE